MPSFQGIGFLSDASGATSRAFGISRDATFAVGNTLVGAGQFIGTVLREAFLWTPTAGIQLLGLLDGAATTATGVSADGTVVSAFAALDSGCHGGAALDERQRAGGVAAARRNGLVQRPEHLRRR